MRWFRAYGWLVRTEFTHGWLWFLLLAIALVGPSFILLDAVTARMSSEPKPLLSEPAMIEHFETSSLLNLSYPGTDNVDLFRSPRVDSYPEVPSPHAFQPGLALVPLSARINAVATTWGLPNSGSALDFYRLLFPILMALLGVLALPAKPRLALLRTVVPSGRLGCYAFSSGLLLLVSLLVGIVTAMLLAVAVLVTGDPLLNAWLFALRYGVLLAVYGTGFSLLGLAVAHLVRNRAVALLMVATLMIGVAPFLSIGQSHIQTVLADAFPSVFSASTPTGSPTSASWIASSLLIPPQNTFYWISASIWSRVPESLQAAVVRYPTVSLASLWGRLAWFAAFWWLIGWATAPRRVRLDP